MTPMSGSTTAACCPVRASSSPLTQAPGEKKGGGGGGVTNPRYILGKIKECPYMKIQLMLNNFFFIVSITVLLLQ